MRGVMDKGSTMKRALRTLLPTLSLLFATVAWSQSVPSKIVVGLPPGGAVDVVARILADRLGHVLSEPMIVENKPGAQARTGVQAVKDARPDGKTLLVTPGVVVSLYPHTFKQLRYDPVKDLTPISPLVKWDLALAVPADAPVKTLADYLSRAKANPQAAFFGTASVGNAQHFVGVKLAQAAKTPLDVVGFKGGREAVHAVVGGQIPAVILNASELLELHKAGKLRILVTFAGARSPSMPDVPTIREAGFPGLEAESWAALYGPAGMAAAEVSRLNAAVQKILAEPDVKEKLQKQWLEVEPGTAGDLASKGQRESAQWAQAVKASGFVPE